MMTEEEKIILRDNIARVKERAAEAAIRAGRKPEEIALVAATKMNSTERIRFATENGIAICGENRVQELLDKYEQQAYGSADLQFIGTLQTNKVKYLIGKVSMIQSVGSLRLGEVIAKEAAKHGIVQDILLEVNIGGEASKSGVAPNQFWPLLDAAAAQPHIRVRGLMAIPPVNDNDKLNRAYLAAVRQLFLRAGECGYANVAMEVLSMGMSGDYENAIREGATLVRIGTAIYGERDYGLKTM